MTKGIAIQTILMLLVGMLVVGILVYMVYRYFIGAPLGEQECRARIISWCSGCRLMDFTASGYQLGELADNCVNKYFGSGWVSGCDCNSGAPCTKTVDEMKAFCTAFTP